MIRAPLRRARSKRAGGITADSVSISPNTFGLGVGETVQLTATVKGYDDGVLVTITRPITWASTNILIASVSNTGLVTAVGAGTCSISATTPDGAGDATPTTISVASPPADHITFDIGTTLGITAGNSIVATATVYDINNNVLTGQTIVWASVDTGKATATTPGQTSTLAAVAAGTTNVTATVGAAVGTIAVTVAAPTGVGSITISHATASMVAGGTTLVITATVRDTLGNVMAGQTITWLSSVPGKASVTSPGQTTTVTPVASGSTNVTATCGAFTSSACAVTVAAAATPNTIVITPGTASLYTPNGTITITAIVYDGAGAVLPGQTIAWATSTIHASITTPGQTATATGLTDGTAVITASSGGITSNGCTITITTQAPGSFPAGYDPNRQSEVGYKKLGRTWQTGFTAGSDNYYTSLKTTAGVTFDIGASGGQFPTVVGDLGLYNDPRNLWGLALKTKQLAHTQRCVTRQEFTPPLVDFWYRQVIMFQGMNRTVARYPGTTGPVVASGWNISDHAGVGPNINSYETWYDTYLYTAGSGESETQKLVFSYPTVGNINRLDMTLTVSGRIACGSVTEPATAVQTRLVQTASTPVAPTPPGSFQGMYAYSIPNAGFVGGSHDMRGTQDWYELVMNHVRVSATEYIFRHFMRRLTINGAFTPWTYPVWQGYRITSGTTRVYDQHWCLGNKSGDVVGPLDHFVWQGPYEITTNPDPYGWALYGL